MGKTATQSIEEAILEATGEKTQAKGEVRKDYLLRLVKAANKLPSDDFDAMPKLVQDWWNDFVEAKQGGKTLPDFPDAEDSDEEDEDDSDADDDEDSDEDDEDDETDEQPEEEIEDDDADGDSNDDDEEEPVTAAKPSSKRQVLADDDDSDDDETEEPAPVKRGPGRPKGSTNKAKLVEDEEETPKRKPGRPKGSGNAKPKAAKEDDEEAEEPKKSVRPRLNELVVKNPNRDRTKLFDLLTKEGFDIKQSSVNVMYYEVVKIIKELNKQGALSKEYAAKLVETE